MTVPRFDEVMMSYWLLWLLKILPFCLTESLLPVKRCAQIHVEHFLACFGLFLVYFNPAHASCLAIVFEVCSSVEAFFVSLRACIVTIRFIGKPLSHNEVLIGWQ